MPTDITGRKFNRLTAIKPTSKVVRESRVWLCHCECGNKKETRREWLLDGRVKSCGCLRATALGDRSRTHGDTGSSEYNTWEAMKRRCYVTTDRAYKHYGGRGITVCKRWRDSYEAFLEDMGRRPPRLTLDRIDNNGNYEPSNCRWTTWRQQMRNKRTTVHVKIGRKTRTLSEWLEIQNIERGTYEKRIASGWSKFEALTRPIRRRAI